MTTTLRFVVVVFGAFFVFLGVVASIGPGFPIAEAPARPIYQSYLQAFASLIFGAALLAAAFAPEPPRKLASPIIWTLVLAPLLLWVLTWPSTPVSASLIFLPLYSALSCAGIWVLIRRRAA